MSSGARQPHPARSSPAPSPRDYREHFGKAKAGGTRGRGRFCRLSPSSGLSLHPEGFPRELSAGVQPLAAQPQPCLSFPIHREGRALG